MITQKSHRCEEGGAHLRISFWHLLIHLKNKYLKILQFLRYRAWQTEIGNFGHFLPFYPNKNQKKIKIEPLLEISSFYTCVPKITIIWCRVLGIRSGTDWILNHFLPFYPPHDPENWRKKNAWRYYPFTHVYLKWRSYDKWFLKYKAQRTE